MYAQLGVLMLVVLCWFMACERPTENKLTQKEIEKEREQRHQPILFQEEVAHLGYERVHTINGTVINNSLHLPDFSIYETSLVGNIYQNCRIFNKNDEIVWSSGGNQVSYQFYPIQVSENKTFLIGYYLGGGSLSYTLSLRILELQGDSVQVYNEDKFYPIYHREKSDYWQVDAVNAYEIDTFGQELWIKPIKNDSSLVMKVDPQLWRIHCEDQDQLVDQYIDTIRTYYQNYHEQNPTFVLKIGGKRVYEDDEICILEFREIIEWGSYHYGYSSILFKKSRNTYIPIQTDCMQKQDYDLDPDLLHPYRINGQYIAKADLTSNGETEFIFKNSTTVRDRTDETHRIYHYRRTENKLNTNPLKLRGELKMDCSEHPSGKEINLSIDSLDNNKLALKQSFVERKCKNDLVQIIQTDTFNLIWNTKINQFIKI
ncbi:MAG: hypothetical protein MK212_00370 [Saprospiraceae bacterium]|nr:hypothetical protein [Saprospiraceae bacterium]